MTMRPKKQMTVVFFEQKMGAQHAVCWSKSFVCALKCNFPSIMEEKERKRKESTKIRYIEHNYNILNI